MAVDVQVKVLKPGAIIPSYQTEGAAGMDLHAYLEEGPVTLAPGETRLVGTGLAIWVNDKSHALHVMARSGNAKKFGIGLANGVGLVDSDYQGELGALLQNLGSEPFTVNHGDRIAQAVIVPIVRAQLYPVVHFSSETNRGAGGFGSTGS